MAFKKKICAEKWAYVKLAGKLQMKNARDIAKECNISLASVYRIWKAKMDQQNEEEKKRNRGGRPNKLSVRQKRSLLRNINKLRVENSNFTAKKLMASSGLSLLGVSSRTVRRFLNKSGYHYLQARKKGVLSLRDVQRRLAFAKKMLKEYKADVWTKEIAFYLDGVSFTHKRNPADEAKAPKGRIWRRPNEGLDLNCTAKGSHEGTGGKLVKAMVAISYKQGVLLYDQYDKLDGRYFSDLIFRKFNRMFIEARKGRRRLWLQDGDPSQNSALAKIALRSVRAKLLSIPPRSPDLNPIENLFHQIKAKLANDAMEKNITKETFDEFSARVKSTILHFDKSKIDTIIESMNERIHMIKAKKGRRIKY